MSKRDHRRPQGPTPMPVEHRTHPYRRSRIPDRVRLAFRFLSRTVDGTPTAKQIARHLQIHEETARRWMTALGQAGAIPWTPREYVRSDRAMLCHTCGQSTGHVHEGGDTWRCIGCGDERTA